MDNFGFWKDLKKPIMALAPMADVTDAAFRQIIAKYGKPDVMWTEFVSADGLRFAPDEGRKKLLKDLEYTEAEKPIVAQLFTSNPESMREGAKLIAELSFDGLDINMGCPDRSIEKQGAGAALIKTPELALELIHSAKAGIKEAGKNIPVSVKTRSGYSRDQIEEWIPALLEAEPAVITIHARNRKEMSKVPAKWDLVKRAVELRDKSSKETLILGNGDIRNVEEGIKIAGETGADGVMFGRAIFGTPWLFANLTRETGAAPQPTVKEQLKILIEHVKLFDKLLGESKSFYIMKKHFKAYVNGWDGAVTLRTKLMVSDSASEAIRIIEEFLSSE